MPFRDDGPPAGDEYVYVPAAYDNRSSADPVRVTLRVPTEAQKRAVYGRMRSTVELDAAGKPKIDSTGKPEIVVDVNADDEWRREVLRQCVVRVDGYERKGPGGAYVPLADADGLIHHAKPLFFYELSTVALAGYGIGEEKKSAPSKRSGSLSRATRPSRGTAGSAKRNGSAVTVGALAPQIQNSGSSRN